MANPEHLKILEKGVEVWNKWRKDNFNIIPNLNYHQFYDAFGNSTAKYKNINFNDTYLVDTGLIGADLRGSKLIGADLRLANLKHSNLSGADLSMANLGMAKLTNANLRKTVLFRTILSGSHIQETDFEEANFDLTIIGGINIIEIKGLESIKHTGPSLIDVNTLLYFKSKIPITFLRGCGVPENFIEHMPSFAEQPIQYYSCFISHSSKNHDFAERLHTDLQNNGVRCWFAPEDMKIGDKILDSIDRSIRRRDKLLLILSEDSIESEWVEDEVNTAFEEERKRKTTVLFPIRLDNAVMDSEKAWAAKLRNRHIGDFTIWKDHDSYRKAFKRLMRDLKAEA